MHLLIELYGLTNGDISMQSLKSYETTLKRTWELQKRMVMLEKKKESAEEQGK